MKKMLLMVLPAFMLAACTQKQAAVPAIDPTDMDLTVAPGEDFYMYANAGWMEKNPLKAEYSRYGSFDVLAERNQERLNELFQSMSNMKTKKGSVEQKIVDLYKQGLDTARRNVEGAEPVRALIESIFATADKAAFVEKLAELNKVGEGGFFGAGAEADLMDSNVQVLYLGQGGLGMGDRDYYLDPANAALKDGYRDMLAKLFNLAGVENAEARAAASVSLEEKLAECSWTRVQNRDMMAIYNPMTVADLNTRFPGFDYSRFAELMEVPADTKVIVEQPSYFEAFGKIFEEAEMETINSYIAGQVLISAAGSLSDEFYAASFDFYSRQMSGVTEHKPLWKRAMSVPNGTLGEAVGKMYVAKYFPAENKARVLAIVNNLRASLASHIDSLDWMSDSTKVYAKEKLDSFTVKIGYPDKWKDYSDLNVDPELSYYANRQAASAWYVKDNLSKLGKQTDRDEWGMTPQTVNAYYNPTTNEICFPAAILQPPFFNADADEAVNYGAIGVVIGHEMTHGFDDQGRLFDKDGNMTNWWTAEDAEAFAVKSQVLVKQFDEIEILPGVNANGSLSLGENIADQGGVSLAYTAMQNSWNGKHPADIDGFTAEQRFFLGYAHVWAQNITDEEKARLTKLDVHSLGKNRVNATLRNFQTFFDAFGIKEGDAMYRPEDERVMIW